MVRFSRRSLMQKLALSAVAATAPVAALAADDTQETAPNLIVEANGIRYAYRRFGAATGTPLVFLMHFRGTMDNWDPAVVNPLAKDRPVILFSNAGVGLTGGETPTSIEGMAKHVEIFIDALKLNAIDLLGFSIGGYVAQQVALDRPGLVRRLVLVGTGPQGGEGMTQFSPEARAIRAKGGGPAETLPGLFFSPSETSQVAARAFLSRLAARSAEREPPVTLQASQAQIAASIAWGKPPESNRYARLAELKMPTLVVNGNRDIMVATVNSYILAQNLPNAKLIIYPDAGHGSLFQHHDDFVGEVSRLLQV